jgi:hypothetical protein
MSQVVQAKCPHCQNVLRIPEEWLVKPMRCKHCKKTFQAKGKSSASASANVQTAVPAPRTKAHAPLPVAQAATAVAAPQRPASSDPFGGFEDPEPPDEPAAEKSKKKKKKGNGLLLLVGMFFFLFVMGAAGASFVVYKAVMTPAGNNSKHEIAKVGDGKGDSGTVVPKNADGANADAPKDRNGNPDKMGEPPPPTDAAKKDRDKDKEKKKFIPPKKDDSKKDLVNKDRPKNPPKFTNDPFPRRALLISVNNYLMFNTVHYGSAQDQFKGGYPGSSTAVLRDRLGRPPMYFPATQIFELSDGIPDNNKVVKPHSTQKSVLEMTIKDFVDSAREQDRILVLFAGHATHLEKDSYLVPIDGNMKKPESLLPLKWVYEQLAKCRAQQKVLVLDLFRFSPSRGFELPSTGDGAEGTMPEEFDKDLQNPPAGVQVLCSCQKEQSSVELDGGSAFMQAFCHSLQGGADMAGIAGPTQPIPVDVLVVKINQRLKDLLTPEKRTQIARLTGTAGTPMGYDAKEALAPQITLKPPTVPGGNVAGAAQVNNILDELRILPAVRDTRAGDVNLLRAQNLPAFSAEKLDGYKNDGYQNLADLEKRYKANNEAYAKEFPLRAAYFEALAALQDSQKVKMRETLNSPIDGKRKGEFLKEQEPLGISIFRLKGALAAIKEANDKREMETSKRWQANFDYVQARLQSRLVYLFEYNYTLGQIRADNLPELAPGQSGWRVGISGSKLNVTENDAKDLAKKTKKLWDKIEESYPDTPWSLLAQRESKIALGLTWKAKSD